MCTNTHSLSRSLVLETSRCIKYVWHGKALVGIVKLLSSIMLDAPCYLAYLRHTITDGDLQFHVGMLSLSLFIADWKFLLCTYLELLYGNQGTGSSIALRLISVIENVFSIRHRFNKRRCRRQPCNLAPLSLSPISIDLST
jgi:hypothetical protein